MGYIHLQNRNTQDAEKYYEVSDHRIFTQTQLVFKTLFWNTELQYSNHYLIALTSHNMLRLANATSMGLQAPIEDRKSDHVRCYYMEFVPYLVRC